MLTWNAAFSCLYSNWSNLWMWLEEKRKHRCECWLTFSSSFSSIIPRVQDKISCKASKCSTFLIEEHTLWHPCKRCSSFRLEAFFIRQNVFNRSSWKCCVNLSIATVSQMNGTVLLYWLSIKGFWNRNHPRQGSSTKEAENGISPTDIVLFPFPCLSFLSFVKESNY